MDYKFCQCKLAKVNKALIKLQGFPPFNAPSAAPQYIEASAFENADRRSIMTDLKLNQEFISLQAKKIPL